MSRYHVFFLPAGVDALHPTAEPFAVDSNGSVWWKAPKMDSDGALIDFTGAIVKDADGKPIPSEIPVEVSNVNPV